MCSSDLATLGTNMEGFVPQYEPCEALVQEFLSTVQDKEVADEKALLPRAPSMAWNANELGDSYVTHLTDEERDEIVGACAAFAASTRSLHELDKSSFPLPLLGQKLAAIRASLHDDLGIAVLRGLDPSIWSMRETFVAFAGLSSHVSRERGRQAGNKMIVHITDLASSSKAALPAPYRNTPLSFHTDPVADVVAMFVIEASSEGGQGIFCPVASICNHLAATCPSLLQELAKADWPFDRPPDGVGSFYRRPVMYLNSTTGAPEMLFSRGALIRSPQGFRPSDVPLLTVRQNAALDAIHFAATSKALKVVYRPGDVLFFNNRRVLHGREAFTDDSVNGTRHLLRLWLRDEELAGTPPHPLDMLWNLRFAPPRPDEDEAATWPSTPHCV